MPKPLPDDVRAALASGQKIEAVRLLREHTGLGLAEAKAAVEAGFVPTREAPAESFGGLPGEVSAALAAGDKLEAIKLLRQSKSLSLAQAKAIVDEVTRNRAPQGKRDRAGLSPGEVPRSRLPPGLIALLLAVAVAVAWFLLRNG